MKQLSWVLALVSSIILLQTLYFKFTAAPESVYIFSQLDVEPWGRIITGILELIVGLMLLLPSIRHLGALIGIGLMSGAILSHLFVLGIEIQGDGGLLFALGLIVFVCCSVLVVIHRKRLYRSPSSTVNPLHF